VIEDMRVIRVIKDVTWSTLNEPGLVDWLKKKFPMRKDLQQPFELYHAAREAEKSRSEGQAKRPHSRVTAPYIAARLDEDAMGGCCIAASAQHGFF
jgi:hypothetical protein